MRFGIGAKIVAIVVFVLVTALATIGGGYRELELGYFARKGALSHLPALPAVSGLVDWYRVRRSWTGADGLLAKLSLAPADLLIVSGGRVRASSSPLFDGATAVVDENGMVRVSRRSFVIGAPGLDIKFYGVPSASIAVESVVVGRLYEVPRLRTLPGAPPGEAHAELPGPLVVLFVVVGSAAIVVGIFLASYVVRPIRELTHAAQTASSSAFARVPVRSRDEIGSLARAFNALGERLSRSEEARENVISDVAHELRTPLTNVRCALESFQDGVERPTPRALQSVLDDVLLLQRLVTDLQDLRTAEAGAIRLALVPTDISYEARSAVAAFSDRATDREVRIEVSAQSSLPLVPSDPARIRQVLHNLLDNALRHGRRGGRVNIDITYDPKSVRVEVSDDGEGFPESEETSIFARFHRLDASRSRSTGGSGLGLAIAKGLIEAHGGRIGARGGAGRGATLWFTLPFEA